jgi:hypothetical protein
MGYWNRYDQEPRRKTREEIEREAAAAKAKYEARCHMREFTILPGETLVEGAQNKFGVEVVEIRLDHKRMSLGLPKLGSADRPHHHNKGRNRQHGRHWGEDGWYSRIKSAGPTNHHPKATHHPIIIGGQEIG